jgi:rhomboid protease GluP
MLRRMAHGSMICPECGKLISVSEEKCPFCGAWRPGMYGITPRIQKLFGRQMDLIALISITCVVLYIAALILQPEAIFQNMSLFSFLSPGSVALYQLGMTGGVAWRENWWWTLLTAQYLHGGLLHIFFNVMWIRNLGPAVEGAYGPARAFVIFNVSGVLGFVVSNFMAGTPTIGASGAIFGMLAALIVYSRRRGISQMSAQLWQWALILFVFGFLMSGVNNWAHAGGFAGGWAAGSLMRPSDEKRETRGAQLFALLLIVATVAGFLLSFLRVHDIVRNG